MQTKNKKQVKIEPIYPFFGGKRDIVDLAWSRLGIDVLNYIEPFFGGGAMLLLRPLPLGAIQDRHETINDYTPFIANFWRAIKHDPAAVAQFADYPIVEIDLHARHVWLIAQADQLSIDLKDPFYFDAKIAGLWVWGMSCYIGKGFGKIANNARPHLSRSQGIKKAAVREVGIEDYLAAFSDRMSNVRVCNGDWARVLSDSVTTSVGQTAVFLDPPYALNVERMLAWVAYLSGEGEAPEAARGATDRESGIYINDGDQDVDRLVASVHLWARKKGSDPRMRIALCGYDGEHNALEALGWECIAWKASGGYDGQNKAGNDNGTKERIWFSPHCLQPASMQPTLF